MMFYVVYYCNNKIIKYNNKQQANSFGTKKQIIGDNAND